MTVTAPSLPQHYDEDFRSLTKIIRGVITFFGLVLTLTIAFAGWAANTTATDGERKLLDNALNQSIARALNEQKSVAWWDDSVVKIADDQVDLEFTDSNFGVFLTETYGHDEVYILDAKDRSIYSFAESKRGEPAQFETRRPSLQAVIAKLRLGEARSLKDRRDEFGDSQTNYRVLAGAMNSARWAGHIISVAGRPALVAAMTIVPNVDLTLLKGVPKLLITVIYIDDAYVSQLGRSLLLQDLALTQKPVTGDGIVSEAFIGDDGSKVGHLSWTTRRPGYVLLTIILPLVAVGVFSTGLLSNHMFRGLRRASDELTEREATARHASKHDALSGLPNRLHMVEKVEAWLSACELTSQGSHAVAAYVDVDRFKDINDTLGHEAGDKLIRAVATRLSRRLRSDDFLARFGGDEFAVLCSSADPESRIKLADRIASAFHDPFSINGQSIRLTASVGIAMAPTHGRTADEVMRHADIALYEAKRLGRDRAVLFSGEMAREVETRHGIEVDLRAAIDGGQLRLQYQPIISCGTGAVTGVEALLRWRHPTRGDVSPAVFIPVAENSGLMPVLGAWVLERAISDAKRWPNLEIAINLSPVQFRHVDLAAMLRRLMDEHGEDPRRFVLEVTEGVLLEATDHTKSILNAIQAMGFRTALDDFGTGYSSLSYLCNFQFDKIKIDRSFVSNMAKAVTSRTIAQSVVALGRGLGMQIVAEGVETEYEALMMAHYGCTELQGYFFSRPIDPDQLTELLATFEPRSLAGIAAPPLLIETSKLATA